MKKVRCLKFGVSEEEGFYYLCSKKKALIFCAVTTLLNCAFVFAYAKSKLCHNAAHLMWRNNNKKTPPIFVSSYWKSMRPSQGFWGTTAFISGEQGNKGQILRGTGEQRQYWGTGNIESNFLIFGEQGNKPIYFRGTREQAPPPPPERVSCMIWVCKPLFGIFFSMDHVILQLSW